ncbi:hypothetical protein M758_6G049700 [Ceratodon purpureus]|nr:hypothetical protein M758_6G049700 [Ceratodon purpureus]
MLIALSCRLTSTTVQNIHTEVKYRQNSLQSHQMLRSVVGLIDHGMEVQSSGGCVVYGGFGKLFRRCFIRINFEVISLAYMCSDIQLVTDWGFKNAYVADSLSRVVELSAVTWWSAEFPDL